MFFIMITFNTIKISVLVLTFIIICVDVSSCLLSKKSQDSQGPKILVSARWNEIKLKPKVNKYLYNMRSNKEINFTKSLKILLSNHNVRTTIAYYKRKIKCVSERNLPVLGSNKALTYFQDTV